MPNGVRAISRPEIEEPRDFKKLIQDIVQDITRIFRAEVQLARAEISEKASTAGRAASAMAGAAVMGLLAAGCFVVTCIAALALVLPVWLSALIMAVFLSLIAGGAYLAGRSRLKQITPTPQLTVRTIKENIEWAKQRT